MKTINQVNRYISLCRFSNEDWVKVRNYVKEKYGVNFHKAVKPKSESTYEGFLGWENHGLATGDIVSDGSTIGIIGYNIPGICMLAAYDNSDDGFVADQIFVNINDYSLVLPEISRDFIVSMNKLCYTFNDRFGIVVEKMVPKSNSYISFTNIDTTGVGIVKEIKDTVLYMHFVVLDNKLHIDYSMDFINTKVDFMDKVGVNKISTILKDNGYMWNDSTHILEKIRYRSQQGDKYWYITDKFSIRSDIERGDKNQTCRLRFDRGNYFTDLQEAMEFLNEIIAIRTKK